jgi:ABC-2 type transport system ATP-binding protein
MNNHNLSEIRDIDHNNSNGFSIVVRNLSKTYNGVFSPAVDHLNLSVKSGEIIGLLGPNGAGKTTAISMMSSVMRPDNGSICLCGIDIYKNPRQARRLFGLVPQDIALYENLTGRENLTYFGRLQGLKRKKLRDRIDWSLEMVGLENKADHRVLTYSGGMKRRANLAAGILHHPRVLFLDEPTVGIDAQSRNMILEKLLWLKNQGVSMIYTTHYMEEAESLCSSVIIIDSGKILAAGKSEDLIGEHPGCRNLGDLFLKLTGKQLRD